MNERIKQLAELSGFKVDWQHEDVQALKMARFEKFAELIVRECSNIAEQYDAPKMSGPGMIIAGRIESHFGVAE